MRPGDGGTLVGQAAGSLKKNILITGRPGIGKTTLVRSLVQGLSDLHPEGFYTMEIRNGGGRKGFSLTGLDGKVMTLAHVAIESSFRVGKYRVDIRGFETFLRTMPAPGTPLRLLIIDEIGKMECLSPLFRSLVAGFLDSSVPLIATIARRGDGFIEAIKTRNDAVLYELTLQNREDMPLAIMESVRAIAGA